MANLSMDERLSLLKQWNTIIGYLLYILFILLLICVLILIYNLKKMRD